MDKPTGGLECARPSFLPRWSSCLGRHASSPGPCLRNGQGSLLPCLLGVLRKACGSRLPLATTIPGAIEVLFRFFWLLRITPRLICCRTFLWICLQLRRKHYRKTLCRKIYTVWIGHWNVFQLNGKKTKKITDLYFKRIPKTPLFLSVSSFKFH